ncbi:MAG: hypothetical protein JXR40_13155 [Pontiellaceae bacterium]|nr:hypothetical protein [Pontiellaceae bacterium]
MDKQLKVIKVVDDTTIVINAGSEDGITANQKFTLYCLDTEDLIDPDTNENLGRLEIVKGVVAPTHIQMKVSTLKSDIWRNPEGEKTIIKRSPFMIALGSEEIVERGGTKTRTPLDDPQVGDFLKIRN